jgi:hypothetical protein
MNVRETVEDALQKQGVPLSPQYQGYANVVITALENREADIVNNLTMFATEQGLSREDAINAMDDCGLMTQSATTAVDGEDPRITAIEQQMAAMQETLRALRG